VSGRLQRRFCVLLATAAAAAGVWQWVPGTGADRVALETVASGFANPPFFVEGAGTQAAPWRLRAFSSEARPDPRQAPLIVSLGDDVQGFFQSSPPAPIDLAVMLTNFRRLGAKKAATAAVLAWEEADPIAFAALEGVLEKFDSLVMAAPLSRGAVASPLPPAFRRASVPIDALKGDASDLPVVNRIPLPGVLLGGENSAAGFSVLESEEASRFVPMLARWEDRVVFSFSLLTVLQRLDLTPDRLEIRPGEFLKLGSNGPVVPIDRYGRLTLPLRRLDGFAEIPAERLIDGGDGLFPKAAPEPVILRDDRSSAEPATQAFSRNLAAAIATIASEDGLAPSRIYPRLPSKVEACLLAAVVMILTLLAGTAELTRRLGGLVLGGACLAAQWIGVGIASVWLPGLPMLAAIATASAVAAMPLRKKAKSAPAVLPDPELAPEPEPVPEPVPVEKPPARKRAPAKPAVKSAPEKAAAKKPPAAKPKKEKSPAPKTAAKKKPRAKKPPPES
jgi:hypothetical protein